MTLEELTPLFYVSLRPQCLLLEGSQSGDLHAEQARPVFQRASSRLVITLPFWNRLKYCVATGAPPGQTNAAEPVACSSCRARLRGQTPEQRM
jgi:hypothetical protein